MTQRKILKCKACGYGWHTRHTPKRCPRCHNDWRKKLKYNGGRKA